MLRCAAMLLMASKNYKNCLHLDLLGYTLIDFNKNNLGVTMKKSIILASSLLLATSAFAGVNHVGQAQPCAGTGLSPARITVFTQSTGETLTQFKNSIKVAHAVTFTISEISPGSFQMDICAKPDPAKPVYGSVNYSYVDTETNKQYSFDYTITFAKSGGWSKPTFSNLVNIVNVSQPSVGSGGVLQYNT